MAAGPNSVSLAPSGADDGPGSPADRSAPVQAGPLPSTDTRSRIRGWLFATSSEPPASHPGPHRTTTAEEHRHPWWKVMCLTGVDYFSTLGYQPGIAALAAGVLSPIATLVLVALTLLGALPVYRRVARESFRGEGSISMLERLLPRWAGKLFVLVLLGFAATDFMITMTLSAADATEHLVDNPYVPAGWGDNKVLITLLLLALLGAVFLRGFAEAIGVAVVLVGVYLAANVVVVAVSVAHIAGSPSVVTDWGSALTTAHSSPLAMIGVALLVFPKLALGLSGFETGVAVMPQIQGDAGDTATNPVGRIRGAHRLLTTAAIIMSVFLIASSFITTTLIPQEQFQPGGEASGRALAFLAHEYLGAGFGTFYDASTIAILWFAGASAMAGLLNLVPRYLPRYGMAPEWSVYVRPLVVVFTVIAFVVTWAFDADVDAQGGAYATGVLVLITSASVAVTLSARRRGQRSARGFAVIAAVFGYTTVVNVFERPDGVKIAALFILGILVISGWSRVSRAFELRVGDIRLDDRAAQYIWEAAAGEIHLVAHEPPEKSPGDAGREEAGGEVDEYQAKERQQRGESHIPAGDPVLFLEVHVVDASEFRSELDVQGVEECGHRILRITSAAVPNSIAALLLHIRDVTGALPHVYFEWTEGNPLINLLRFLFVGAGEVAPTTREVLRRAEPNRDRRPKVHVG